MSVCTVLMAEDEEEWFDFVSFLLPSDRYRLLSARTARDAIQLAAKAHPEFAILDLMLPDMFGVQLCQKLRELPGLEELPVVALSSYEQEKARGLQMGLDGFVDKASAQRELLLTVEAILRRVQMDTGILAKDDLKLDPRDNLVFLDEKLIAKLSPKEFLFFYALVQKSPEPASELELKDIVLQRDATPSALEVLVARTKKRLGPPLADRIQHVRDSGWVYSPDPGPHHANRRSIAAR